MTSITPPAPLAAGTSIALLDTMTIRDTVLGVAGVLEIRAPLAGVITHQVLVVEALTQGGVRMEETTAVGVATTTIRPVDLHRAMIAILRVVIVTAVAAAEVVGGTAPAPLPRRLAVTHLRRDLVGIPPVPHKEVPMAVHQGNIQSPRPEEVMGVPIITAVVLAPLDKGLLLMTVMDHRLVVVVVVLVLVVGRTAADRWIAEEIPVPMVPRQIPAEVQPVMISLEATEEEEHLHTGELKLP